MRLLAAAGLALTATMQVIFAATAGDRPFPYLEIQILAVLASLAAAWGLWRQATPAGRTWLAVGLGVNALMRFAQIAMGLSRLPLLINLALLAGYVLAAIAAAQWARGSALAPGRLTVALWLLAGAYFLSLLFAISRMTAAIALALGTAGMALAAPNLDGKAAIRS